jgi:hypothetical protein
LINSLNRDFQHQARPTGIGDQQVTATAEDEQRKIARARECNRLLYFSDIPGFDEIPGWASDFEGGQGSERNVFEQIHNSFSIYTRAEADAPACGLREYTTLSTLRPKTGRSLAARVPRACQDGVRPL